MTTTSEHWWGRRPPDIATVAWGARAIYTPGREPVIDLLWDRQSARGPADERKALCAWLDSKGLKGIKAEAQKAGLRGDSSAVISWSDGGQYVIEASPNASHGYLYLLAYDRNAATSGTFPIHDERGRLVGHGLRCPSGPFGGKVTPKGGE